MVIVSTSMKINRCFAYFQQFHIDTHQLIGYRLTVYPFNDIQSIIIDFKINSYLYNKVVLKKHFNMSELLNHEQSILRLNVKFKQSFHI